MNELKEMDGIKETFGEFGELTTFALCTRFLLKHFGRRDTNSNNITRLLELALIKSDMQKLTAHDSLLYVMFDIKKISTGIKNKSGDKYFREFRDVNAMRFIQCYDIVANYYEHNNHYNKKLDITSLDIMMDEGHDVAVMPDNNIDEYICIHYEKLLHNIKTDAETTNIMNKLEKADLTESERKYIQRYFTRHIMNAHAQGINTKSRQAKKYLIELALTA